MTKSLIHEFTLRAVISAMSLEERDALRRVSQGVRPDEVTLGLLERRQLLRRLQGAAGDGVALTRLGAGVADVLAGARDDGRAAGA
jgi:hypothetical protein